MGSNHQNEIFDIRIKELNLGSRTILLHATSLLTDAVRTMMWNLSFKLELHRHNSLEMDKDG